MGNEKYISLIMENNSLKFAEYLCSFYLKDYDSNYIVYSLNKSTWNNKTIIHVGKMIEENEKEFLTNIESYDEWNKIRTIINNINKYGIEGDIIG